MSAQTFHLTLNGETIKVKASSREKAIAKGTQIFSDRRSGIVKRSRNRETGTEILLVDRELLAANSNGTPDAPGEDRWETICDEHSTVCSHETRAVAESFMPIPSEWCEDCAAAYSTAGKGSWDDFSDSWVD